MHSVLIGMAGSRGTDLLRSETACQSNKLHDSTGQLTATYSNKVLSLLKKGIYSDSMHPDSIPVCKRARGLQPTNIYVIPQVN